MKNKILNILLIISMLTGTIFSLTGCKNKDTHSDSNSNTSNQNIQGTTQSNKLQVGDIVNYNAGNNGSFSYTTNSNVTGSSKTVTYSSNDDMYSWRFLGINESGQIELIGGPKSVSKNLTLGTSQDINSLTTAFKNAETILNDIGAVYGHGKGAESGRSVNITDIEKHSSYDKTSYDKDFGKKVSYTDGDYFFKQKKDSQGNVIGYEAELSKASKNNPIEIVNTLYKCTKENASKSIPSDVYMTLFKNIYNTDNSYWLASRYAYPAQTSGRAAYGMFTVSAGGISTEQLFDSRDDSSTDCSRPVSVIVTLKSDVKLTEKDEKGVWQLNIE